MSKGQKYIKEFEQFKSKNSKLKSKNLFQSYFVSKIEGMYLVPSEQGALLSALCAKFCVFCDQKKIQDHKGHKDKIQHKEHKEWLSTVTVENILI